jgi:hypothetical protein
MVTHVFPLDDRWRDAFRTLADQGDTGALKVAFAPTAAPPADSPTIDSPTTDSPTTGAR